MAEISKIKLPSGNTYDLKDAVARSVIPESATAQNKLVDNESLSNVVGNKQDSPIPGTWSQIKGLRDSGRLSPGTQYRITDYVATTTQAGTGSANHPFDIIVIALTEATLSEEARATIHEGDTYFSRAGAKLESWVVKYCIDNDAARFAWADTVNGKGVVYYMCDEHGNALPYDFKGIQFKRYKITVTNDILSNINGMYVGIIGGGEGYTSDENDYKWYYSFSLLGNTFDDEIVDASIFADATQNNVILNPRDDARRLNDVVFANGNALYDFLHALNANTANVANVVAVNIHAYEEFYKVSAFGTFGNNFMKSQFRDSTFVVGKLAHTTFQSDFQSNTIVATRHFMTSDIGVYFTENVIYAEVIQAISVGANFSRNILNLNGQCTSTTFAHNFQNNTFSGTFGLSRFGGYLTRNTFTDVDVSASSFDGQVTDSMFSGAIKGCSFRGFLSYITIPSDSSTGFFNVDVMGSIRGSSSTKVELDYAQFRRADAKGVSKRVRIEGDNNGKIVATWYDSGKRVGVTKSVGDTSWTLLPESYTKPSSGIPASDLASGVIPDVSQFITNSVNDLVNYYLKSEVYTKEEVASLIGAIQQFHYEIAASTSAVSDPQSNVLYLIGPSGAGSDKYEEYVYSNGWVKIGDTSIDLSGYVTIQALNDALANYATIDALGELAYKSNVGLNKGTGDNVLGESTSFTTAPSAVSFAAHTTETFVKSVKAETNKKLVTTTVPNVTSVGSPSTWSFSMGTGTDAETLIVSGGNGTAPTLGTEKTVATGATDTNGTGSPIVTEVTVGSSAAAITALGAATAAAQTITVGTNDKVKVAKYDDLSVKTN